MNKKILEKINSLNITKKTKLEGGVTNNTYLLETPKGNFILRVAGFNTEDYIDRRAEIFNLKIAEKHGITPKIYEESQGTILMEYLEHDIELDKNVIKDKIIFNKILQKLYMLHNLNESFYSSFDIKNYIVLYQKKIIALNESFPEELMKAKPILDDCVSKLYQKYEPKLVPCHIDPKINNFILHKDKVYLIDWEYSNMADVYFDLANFTLTNELNESEENYFLHAYSEISGKNIIKEKYLLYKICTDYLWCFWHLIKLYQNENVKYNEGKWRERLYRALDNYRKL